MIRDQINAALKEAMKSKDQISLSTIRLITAALKDRDIAARSKGQSDGIGDDEILSMMQTMIKQRVDSAKMYRDGGRPELAESEEQEILVIQNFLPAQLSEAEIDAAIEAVIAETEASSVKDMGKVMAALKAGYAGQMDFSAASQKIKTRLMGQS
ncbi:MAG: GatB/YqeY domain-containing protein [Candidatus Puniceispirillaceae bacterium]